MFESVRRYDVVGQTVPDGYHPVSEVFVQVIVTPLH